jgi:glycosyltransferase involved in cell wall biosynthesis
MSVSVVMPCYNEEKTVEQVVRDYYNEAVAGNGDSEFIAVDDCSTDNTAKILDGLKKELPRLNVMKTPLNSGHGKALRTGYEAAQKEWVFQLDSDGQFDAKDFQRLYAERDKYDFILGFRKVRRDPLHRLFLSGVIRMINFFVFGAWVKDANCPFRLIKKETLDGLLKLFDKEAMAPNIMISVLAKRKGIKTIEIPVAHYEKKTGTASLTHWALVKFAYKGFWQLLKNRFSGSVKHER